MKSHTAVVFVAGEPLHIVEIDVAPLRAGEVLIKITQTGVCHTDAFTLSGDDPEAVFPAVLGHEGSGILVEDAMKGEIELEPLVKHTIPLEQINEVFELMHDGKSVRSVVHLSE